MDTIWPPEIVIVRYVFPPYPKAEPVYVPSLYIPTGSGASVGSGVASGSSVPGVGVTLGFSGTGVTSGSSGSGVGVAAGVSVASVWLLVSALP